jgi:hypothetical protein
MMLSGFVFVKDFDLKAEVNTTGNETHHNA